MTIRISERFPRYTEFDPQVPVWCVTPGEGRTIHRFFDTSPFSPSGRYLAAFRLPQENRLPEPGEVGQIVLVDLHTGAERVVAETRGWETQMGANVNWGADDAHLLFNDVDPATWAPFGVCLDPQTGASRRLEGCVYRASPDGRCIAAASMERMRRTQHGYGVVIPDDRVPHNHGLVDDDGLWITDVRTGRRRLLVSLRDCVRRAVPRSDFNDADGLEVYGFHCKWNRQGDRLIFTVRAYPADAGRDFDNIGAGVLRFDVYTLDNDARDIRLAVPADQWDKGGHHINWFPDGRTLSMNLNIRRDGLRFVRCGADGSGLAPILETPPGSGHPTIHPDDRHILTDAYCGEPVGFGDGTIPLRWVDRRDGSEQTLVRMRVRTPQQDACSALRVDPHPAWDATGRWIAFNGFADGTRQVYVADLSRLIGG